MNRKCYLFLIVSLSLVITSCLKIEVMEVSFNHDTSGWTDDALNIRQNLTSNIDVPEWTKGEKNPSDSPAAYVGGREVEVMARFRANRDGTYKICTRGGPFQLEATKVRIQNGVSVPAWVTFKSTRIPYAVSVNNARWRWKRKMLWIFHKEIDATNHRFYVVLNGPNEPWNQSPYPDTQNPWTEALDFSSSWAAGENTPDGVEARITEKINSGPYGYDMSAGGTHYGTYGPRRYNLTAFIERLKGGYGNGALVNCSDCGMSVTIFANLLGSDLWSSRMGWSFSLNEIIPVGHSSFGCPNWGCGFSYHEVAWKGGALASDPVHDACLKVDGDSDPANAPHTPLLPVNMIFDDPSGVDYRERLVTPDSLSNCQARPLEKVRPSVY